MTQKYKENIYKNQFYKQIKEIIGSPEDFIKMKKLDKEIISRKLKDLAIFSEVTNLFKKDFNFDLKEFDKEKELFKLEFDKEMSKIIKRKDSAEFKNQLILTVSFLLDYAEENGCLNKKTIDEIIEKIDTDRILYILIKSALSSIKYINMDEYEDEYKYNDITRTVFLHKFTNNFLIYIMSIILENDPQFSNLIIRMFKNIPNIIYKSQGNTQGQCFFKSSLQLIWIFNHLFKIKENNITFKNKLGATQSMILLTLPDKLLNYNIPATHIPEIVEPTITYKKVEDIINLSKKIKNGFSDVELSQETIKALTISQKKKFLINDKTIELFELLDNALYDDIKYLDSLPFTPISHLIYLENKIKSLENEIKDEVIDKINKYYMEKEYLYIENLNDTIVDKLNITHQELNTVQEIYKLKKEYKKRVKLRILHNTIIEFAKTFKGFPIYFTNAYDYRLRMYPWNYMFNRTSGIYKYLLNEWPTNINLEGIKNMIKAYYKNDLEKIKIFNNIEKKEEIIRKFNKIENIKLERVEENEKSYFYRKLLWIEIKNLESNKFKTGFMIEIDQKSSASVILSIVLGDKKLAEESNLISIKEKKDINNFIMNEASKWFENIVDPESHRIISSNRDLHKYLFMCFIYNETFWGRNKRIKEYITNSKDQLTVAKEFPNFINSIFSNVYIKKELFNNIIRYYIKNTEEKPINIETLDGSLITWFIFQRDDQKNFKIKVRHPISNEKVSVHYNLFDIKNPDINKIISGMIPNLIHSIDGAIMRLIINEVYNQENYIINHLHDSIQFHPKYYKTVIKSIELSYTSNKIKNILKNKVFNKLRVNLLDEKLEGYDKIVDEFFNFNYDEIEINSENLNIDAMFPFE